METLAQNNYAALCEKLSRANDVLIEIAQELLAAQESSDLGTQWVREWGGETLTKKEAAKMLNCSVTYLVKLIKDGHIKTTPDGRVIVRSAAAWVNSESCYTNAAGKPRAKKQSACRWHV